MHKLTQNSVITFLNSNHKLETHLYIFVGKFRTKQVSANDTDDNTGTLNGYVTANEKESSPQGKLFTSVEVSKQIRAKMDPQTRRL